MTQEEQSQAQEWVTLTEAAQATGVSVSKVSKLARQGRIQKRDDPRDERAVLVDLNELKRYFNII